MSNQISEIQIIPIKPQDGLVGFASLVYDNSMYLGSIGIVTRPEGGYRLTYPTRKIGPRNINVFHPINKDFAQYIEKQIIMKFEEILEQYDRHN